MDLIKLPQDVLFSILQKIIVLKQWPFENFKFLKKKRFIKSNVRIDPRVLGLLCCVSKDFNQEFSDNYYWLKLLVRDFKKNVEYKRIPKNPRILYKEKIINPYYQKQYDKNKKLVDCEKARLNSCEKDKNEIMKCIREALLTETADPVICYTDPWGRQRLLNGYMAFSIKHDIFMRYNRSQKNYKKFYDKNEFYGNILGIHSL